MTDKDKQKQSAREMANRIARALSEPTKSETWLAIIQREQTGVEVEIFRTQRQADDHLALALEFENEDAIVGHDVVPLSLYNLRNEYGEVDVPVNTDVDSREYKKRPTGISWPENEPDDTGYIPPYSAPPGFNRNND